MKTDNQASLPSHPRRWLPELATLTHKRLRAHAKILGSAALVGVIAGLGAVLFAVACQCITHYALDQAAGYRPTAPAGEATVSWWTETSSLFRPWMLLLVPVLGGLASGVIVFTFAPEAEGHGTDAAIAAYHHKQGKIRSRVPLIKLITSALTIGTGGSGGREGPIALIGAGFGSYLAKILKLRPADRRVLMAAGMGAGVAAIFRAPLAGALFASEVLYWSPEFEPEVIIPAGLSSVISYCTFGLFFGWHPLFATPSLSFGNPFELLAYLLLIVAMVILAMIYTRSFYGLTYVFRRLPLLPHLKPALGAFLSALVGLALYFLFGQNRNVLAVLSFGYGILQDALLDQPGITALLLLAVAIGKILTTGLTIGSGGSGGVFGPSMVIGGCGGGALGLALHALWPNWVTQPASFVVVGMAGFFAAAAKTPFSTLVIVSEMTGDYRLILPALFVCTLAFLLSDEQSLYSSQVESRAFSPAHQGSFARAVLSGLAVKSFVMKDIEGVLLHPSDDLDAMLGRFEVAEASALPVVDGERKLLGVVSIEEICAATQATSSQELLLAADLLRSVSPLQEGDQLDRAMAQFSEQDLVVLPVVDASNRIIGTVRRQDISGAYLRRIHGQMSNELKRLHNAH
jgi:CIC family chloride channel protein